MIDPLRYRSLQEQLEFDEDDSPMQCWQCLRERVSTPAFFLCHDCGKAGVSRPFCEPCFFDYHLTRRGKDGHKPHPIVQGDPVTVQTLADGDGTTFAKMHDWVTIDYTLTTDETDVAIEDTFLTKQPLTFQSGCSGPCVHLQLLGCTEIAAADIMGASDPYCAVYWKNEFVGVTTTKHMTLNPTWANQTFVLPLAAEFVAALDGEDLSSVLFNAGGLLPKLRIELYDWDRLSKNDFLGQATVSDAEILRVLRRARSGETDENLVLSFDLEAKQSRGQLGVRVALRGSKLYVHVMQAENLPKADPFSLSDPYCEVYWNDKRIGKTAHIDDTLDPVWDLEIFSVRVDQDGPNSVEESTLRILCFDWDQFGSDDVLGQIELAGSQIKQLIESTDGDEVVEDQEEGVMGEADMEKVFDFIRLLQEHEMDESLGKMVVGVPQDPCIPRQAKDLEQQRTSEAAAAEVEPSKKTKRKKKKRKHGAADASSRREPLGNEVGEGEELSSSRIKPQETLDPDAVDPARNNATAAPGSEGDKLTPRAGPRAERAQESEAAAVSVEGTSRQDGTARDARGQTEKREYSGQDGEAAEAIEGGGKGLRNDGNKKGVDFMPITSEGHAPIPNTIRTGEAGVAQGNSTVRASVFDSNAIAVGTEGKDTAGDQSLLSEAPRKRENAPQSISAQETASADGNVPGARQTADVRNPSTAVSPRAEKDRKATIQNSKVLRYRDANVQRFEEDRGVLVEYLDDESSAWVETRLIPLLQIRLDAPTARNFFQRLWDLRHKAFNLHKRVLNVKRGMKVLMGVAMTGSRMQWYPLELTDEQSGANFVRGTVDCRFLYHTRGSVLRGLDVAVSHMSLGERARVEVRSDYGFGEVYASRNVPPYATLIFVAQVAAIGHRSAKWLVMRRALRDKMDDALFRFRMYLSSAGSSYGVVRRFVDLLESLRRNKRLDKLATLRNEDEGSFGNPAVAVEEGEATIMALKQT